MAISDRAGQILLLAGSVGISAATSWAGPVLDAQTNVVVPARKTLILPVTASSPEGRTISYTVTSSAPSEICVTIHTNNPWLKLCVKDFGEMEFQLLPERAPVTVGHISALVQGGFYDGLTFHRVIPGFMIQGGDPLGNGTGGPGFRFGDEFHAQAQFTGNGQLAMANSGDDSNGSQFFITASQPRHLDFDHTIFGQLTRGFGVVNAIINVPRNASDKPLTPVVIEHATLYSNSTDTVISLTATNGASTSATIMVVATDSSGEQATNMFTASRVADGTISRPFLGPLTNRISPIDTPVQIPLTSTDIEGLGVEYGAEYTVAPPPGTLGNITNNIVTITPPTGYTGPITLRAKVRRLGSFGAFDTQVFTIAVGDAPSTVSGTDFLATNGVAFSNRVVGTFTNALPARVVSDYTASINWGDGAVTTNGLIRNRVPGPGFEVVGGHTYSNGGDQRVVVGVATILGSSASVTSSIVVPPALTITRSNGSVFPRWPAWAFTYQLQSSTNFNLTNWTTHTNPAMVVGCENVVSNSTGAVQQFFRLIR